MVLMTCIWSQKYKKTSKKITFKLIFFIYIAFILFMVFALYHNPIIALIFFVLISSFHFGEQQWYNKSMISSNSDKYKYYGVLLFSILFISNFNETQSIINEISSSYYSKRTLILCFNNFFDCFNFFNF